MDLLEPTRQAFGLLASGDARLWGTIWVSLWVAIAAIALTAPAAIAVGFLLAKVRFPGRRALIVLMQALLSFPTVVIGLMVYLLL
jgi:tungstate transport system permease protein